MIHLQEKKLVHESLVFSLKKHLQGSQNLNKKRTSAHLKTAIYIHIIGQLLKYWGSVLKCKIRHNVLENLHNKFGL